MPLDIHARRFLEMLAGTGQVRGRYDHVSERRNALKSLTALADPPVMTPVGGAHDHLMRVAGGNLLLRVYSPAGEPARLLPGLLFLHGGGWVAGSVETHDGLCRRLCNETGCRVIAVDYRLAPEHEFPVGLNDCCMALAYVRRNAREFGIDPARLGVGGDGAGANLAAALCLVAREAGDPLPAFQLLLCPLLGVGSETASRRELSEGYFLDRDTLERDLELYWPRADLDDARLSPLRADDLSDLPPAFVHTAQFDPLGDEGEDYARRLADAGVAVQGRTHPGMIHFFHAMPRMIPYALEAAAVIGAEIRHAMKLPRLRERRAQMRTRPALIRE